MSLLFVWDAMFSLRCSEFKGPGEKGIEPIETTIFDIYEVDSTIVRKKDASAKPSQQQPANSRPLAISMTNKPPAASSSQTLNNNIFYSESSAEM
eukprot:scaffold23580_cov40-Cyclotella_meneghiniana.AAC.1